tara:strand:+ start:188 stop:841 length:654 start_codon:yes stop_codon:yes gene_type:complete
MSDIIAGICAGIGQIIVGHPLDTIKVLIQNNTSWKTLKPTQFYRGCTYPFISSILFNSIAFTTYERTKNKTESSVISGALAGFLCSPILFLFDVGKIRNQTNQRMRWKHLINTPGLTSTFCREVLATSIYFGTYEYFNKKYTNAFVSGGLSGLATWTFTYPVDVIRSRQIAQNLSIRESLKMGNLWCGYIPCAIRAILVNGVCFSSYETVYNFLEKD